MSDPHTPAIPSLALAQKIFLAKLGDPVTDELLEHVKSTASAPLWRYIHATVAGFPIDEQQIKELEEQNGKEIARLKAEIAEAAEKEGEMEVGNKSRQLAEFYASIGENALAISAFEESIAKTPTLGAKIDLHFALLRVHLFFLESNVGEIEKVIEATRGLIDQGGDWDRRNRLKAYTGLYYLYVWDWTVAGDGLLDSLSTFTATEIASFEEMVLYGTLAGVASLSRTQLKTRVVDASEVVGTLPEYAPSLDQLVNCLYTSSYRDFFSALAKVEQDVLKRNRYLHTHVRFFTRSLRQKAYAQLLSSYTTLSLASLASTFAVSPAFVEADLEKMIADGKLPGVVIDRVNALVEMNRVDGKMGRYEEVVKNGDEVLRKVQRYAGVVRSMGVAV